MSTISLNFTKLHPGGLASFSQYPLSESLTKEILEAKGLQGKTFIFSFSRILDFDQERHFKVLDNLFNDDEDSSYDDLSAGKTSEEVLKDFYFACGILHNLNLKQRIADLCNYMIVIHKIPFEVIKEHAKSDTYNMQIFHK
jgi:hypothetical protein